VPPSGTIAGDPHATASEKAKGKKRIERC
jgi:hypothetical protein